jgi:hypothetical protein
MANDFDQPPLYSPITRDGDLISDIWINFMSTEYMNLIGYLTQFGILLPQVTTVQRDSLNTIQNGQMIYNTTLGTAQYFKAGAWVSF